MKRLALKPLVALLIASMLILSSAALPAMAQQGTSDQDTATSSAKDPEANLPYLFAVYAITWVIFFVYLYYLSQRQRNLRREVEELREALSERERQGEGP
jgi:CcmD family protein